jgi:hypothetical protein
MTTKNTVRESLTETVKSFLGIKKPKELSTEVNPIQVRVTADEDYSPFVGGFFDGSYGGGLYANSDKTTLLEKQKLKIASYRMLARQSDVNDAIEEIVNEVIFSTNEKRAIEVNVEEENEKIKDAIIDKFDKIYNLMNLDRNLFSIVRNGYIDGQMVAHLAYDKTNTKSGIQKIEFIDPVYFYFNPEKETYSYLKKQEGTFLTSDSFVKDEQEFSREEIVKEDFGLYSDGVVESYLEPAIKPANQLKTLEDLLVPMRFSRSVSRRVFNVDIGDLSPKSGESVLNQYQNKFKYKKFYNVETGEVTNQQHITSMVEDYWFANRSGGKGTTVETIDETGNLGELGDIIYFYKKLYKALKIPANRIPFQTDIDSTFDFTSTSVTKDDVKFFMFISRVRKVYSSLFKKILQREVISSGILTADEWAEYEDKIEIQFINENKFIEKMSLDAFTSQLDLYTTAKDIAGNVFSYNATMKRVFGMTDIEIEENLKEIEKEKKNKMFKDFYTSEDEDM